MDRSKAEDVLQTFLAGITNLDQSKILQVASDGSNVNRLFLKNSTESREEKELLLLLLHIGRCGLHVFHEQKVLQNKGKKESNWELQKKTWRIMKEVIGKSKIIHST